jgi:hypothetical protein
MIMIEKLPKRVLAVGLLSVLGLSACETYDPDNNTFEVVGKVTDPGKESLKVNITEIGQTEGKANGWFKVGNEHQIHDNCNCYGSWNSNKQYGVVLSYYGLEMNPNDVDQGSCVELRGKIRDIQSDDNTEYRPVYDVAQIVDG